MSETATKSATERWEIQTQNSVYVWQYDARRKEYAQKRIDGSGRAPNFINITVDDREYNESLMEAQPTLNPFRNGMLVKVEKGGERVAQWTNEQLKAVAELTEAESLEEVLAEIGDDEITLRRLAEVIDREGYGWASEVMRDTLERYSVAKSQKVIRDVLDESAEGGETLSA